MKITLHGTWTLNAGRSVADPGPLVRSEVRIYEASGDDGLKLGVVGVDSAGAHYSYGAIGRIDGKDWPLTGSGTRNGADSTSWTRIDAHTFESAVKKAGRVVNQVRFEVSVDGNVLTLFESGTSPDGRATRGVRIYDRKPAP